MKKLGIAGRIAESVLSSMLDTLSLIAAQPSAPRDGRRSSLHGLPSWVRIVKLPAVSQIRDPKQFRRGQYASLPVFSTVWDDRHDRTGYSRADLRQLRAVRGVGSVRRVAESVRRFW
jgi:hypothetical protein